MTRQIDVFTLFPEWFAWMGTCRPIANAVAAEELRLGFVDMREYSPFKHRQMDDTPYGGGAGMVLRVDCVVAALEGHYGQLLDEIRQERRIITLTPAGRQFDDAAAVQLATDDRPVTILCGRYEGFDFRVHQHVATEELSIGPYVLSGGEIAAMAIVDAAARKLPGALGNGESLDDESFSEGLAGGLEYPHYTRPATYRGWDVPEILSSGDHGRIRAWRMEQSADRLPGAAPQAPESGTIRGRS